MRISEPPPRRPPAENMLPMINVVFLLLIFFMISAQLAPPEPFAITPPVAEGEEASPGELMLFLGPEGELGYRELVGDDDAALDALAADRDLLCPGDCPEPPVLVLRADAGAPATRLASLMPRLGGLGFAAIELVTAAP